MHYGYCSNIQKVSLGPESEAVDTESEGSGAIGTEPARHRGLLLGFET